MATSFDNTKPSRRAALASIGKGMLGAVTVSALTASVGKCTGSAQAAIPTTAWEKAVKAERRARAVMQRYHRMFAAPCEARHAALRKAFVGELGSPFGGLTDEQRAQLDAAYPDEMEQRYDGLMTARDAALFALIKTPAPTVAALHYKLTLINENDRYGLDLGDRDDAMPHILADTRRLASREA